MSEAGRAATQDYRQDSDTLGMFIEDVCELGARREEPSSQLYEAYGRWCTQSGEHQLTLTTFGNLVQERGILDVKRGGKKYRVGIQLRMDVVYARARAAAAAPPPRDDLQGGLLI